MSAMTPEPDDLRLWRERQRSGKPTPWEELGIRLLEDDEVPELLDDSYLTEDDLADPGIRANVRAMAETNALITWVAEEDGERAYGYWHGPAGAAAAAEKPADGAATGAALVSLDTEGQYMMLAGRTLTEALCAEAAEYEDEAFAALVGRARELAAETDAELAASLVTGETIAELWNPAVEGPGRYRDARYRALLQEEPGEEAGDPDPAADPALDPAADPAPALVASPEPSELPEDLLRWRARAAAGETAPWDRFGVRFLAEGELPGEVARSEAHAAESGVERDRIEAEATRATAELATWVLESDEGVALGYWYGPEGASIDTAQIALLEPSEWFDAVRGRTLTDAMCLAFGEYEDELIAPLARECRALGFEVTADAYDDFPEPEGDGPSTYRYEFKKQLGERARAARIAAAEAAAEERARRSAAAPKSEAAITGELPTLIAALGHGADDAEAQAALALFGPPFERSQYPVGGVTRTYYVAERKHAELIFEDGVFEDARIWIRGSEERGAYARPEGLVDGVGPDTTRELILERFGTPEWSNDHADRFWIAEDAPNRVFVRFEYVDGRVADISVTRESPEQ